VAIVEHPSGVNINFILNANQTDETNQLMDVVTKHMGYTHIALEIDNTASVLAELKLLGIHEPMTHSTGTSFLVRDPDNNVIEFIEYKGLGVFKG